VRAQRIEGADADDAVAAHGDGATDDGHTACPVDEMVGGDERDGVAIGCH